MKETHDKVRQENLLSRKKNGCVKEISNKMQILILAYMFFTKTRYRFGGGRERNMLFPQGTLKFY